MIFLAIPLLFGIVVGSFLNVCIHRMPRDESIANPPRSRCPHCAHEIGWRDNIPLLSYLLLKGRCRHCGKKFSFRYFLVELVNGLLWVYLWTRFGWSGYWIAGAALFSILLAVTMTDLETGYIPDKLTFPGMAAGIILSLFFPLLHGKTAWLEGLRASALGWLIGGGILLAVGVLGSIIFRKDAMGGGDIKLMAMMGTFLGWQKMVLVFFAAPFVALPVALYIKFIKKEETLPYGPYLAAAGAWAFLYGDRFMHQYYLNLYF